MKPHGFPATVQFLVLLYSMGVKGTTEDFISNFPWLPANFDQFLIFTDCCAISTITLKGNNFGILNGRTH